MANTELKVDVDVTGDQQLGRLERRLYRVNAAVKALGASSGNIGSKYSKALNDHLTKTDGRWKKHFDDIDALIKKFGTATLGGLKLALKAAGAEFALMAVSMVAIHGLFKIGHGLMKTYTGALNVLSGAAAGATIALAGVAAAMREQQAAMFSYRGNAMGGYDKFVTGLNKVRVVMRGLHRDQGMLAAGAANLDAAFSTVSRTSQWNRGSQNMLRGLMDFASTGDLKTGMTNAGELIAALQDPKKGMSEIRKVAQKMGKPMEDALKEVAKTVRTREDLIAAITSGALAEAGGVSGQWGSVSQTLISQFKLAATTIKQDFADLGQEFLKPLKEALSDMVHTFRGGMTQVWRPLVEFGRGPFLSALTGFAEKTTEMFVSFIRRGPEVEGMFKRMGDRWKGFVDGWNNVLDRLRPLIDGARVLEEMFGNIFGEIGRYIRESFGTFNDMLQENEAEVSKFGTRLGELFAAFGRFQNELKELFFKALPYINKVLSGVRTIVDLLTTVMRSAGGMLGGIGDGVGAYGLLASAMVILRRLKNWAGGFLLQRQTQTMNVNAGTVNIGGAGGVTGVTAGGQLTPLNEQGRAAMDTKGMRSMTKAQQASTRELQWVASGGDPSQLNSKGYPRGIRNYMMRPAGSPGMISRFGGNQLRNYRDKWAGPRNRINNSMGMKMGMGMGIGMLGNYVGEESQGAMALGGMASFMNPMIGAGIAGLGLAGTSQNAMMATLGGAGGGAALGMQFAGPWGALGGAIVGGAYGWMTAGARKEAAQRKKAKEAGEAVADTMLVATVEGLRQRSRRSGARATRVSALGSTLEGYRSQMTSINELAFSGNAADQARGLHQLRGDPQYADAFSEYAENENIPVSQHRTLLVAIGRKASENYNELNDVIVKMTKNTGKLTDAFDMTEDEMQHLASTTETDLFSATVGWGTLAIQLASGLVQNMREMGYASADRMSVRHNQLRDEKEFLRAPYSMDESAQNIVDILRNPSGDGREDQASILTELANIDRGMGVMAPTQTAGERGMYNALKEGGTAYGPDGPFAGREAELMAIPGWAAFVQQLGADVTMQKVDAGSSVFARLTQGGLKGFTQEGVRSSMADVTMDQLEASGILNEGTFYNEDGTMKNIDDIKKLLAAAGLDITMFDGLMKMTKDDMAEHTDVFEGAVKTFADAVKELIAGLGQGDTATPRRGMLNMKDMLGRSRNSDHRFGGAQDFYGSSLGALQTDIRNAGGYAEMHGISKTRHLHGVPGGGEGAGGTSNSYVINVTGGDNATPSEIADEVMDRIDRRSVDMIERA